MKKYKRILKRLKRVAIYSGALYTIVGLILFLSAFFLMFGIISNLNKVYFLNKKINEIETQKHIYKQNIDNLKEEIEFLQTDYGQEKKLRSEFDIGKPGERVLKIVIEEKESDNNQDNHQGLFNKIKVFLKSMIK